MTKYTVDLGRTVGENGTTRKGSVEEGAGSSICSHRTIHALESVSEVVFKQLASVRAPISMGFSMSVPYP